MPKPHLSSLRQNINDFYLTGEARTVVKCLELLADYNPDKIQTTAKQLVTDVRSLRDQQSIPEAFLQEYQLDSKEGVILMNIAEALLRIPDSYTQDLFLQEKLSSADWEHHQDHSASALVNLSTRALALTSRLEEHFLQPESQWLPAFENLLKKFSSNIIRNGLQQAMQLLAWQFVLAETIDHAIERRHKNQEFLYSFDMLGEAALTTCDAERYFRSYHSAIESLSAYSVPDDIFLNPGISIKLSALYPRYDPLHHQIATAELSDKLLSLALSAKSAGISVTVDAEESDRLDMSLDIFFTVFSRPELNHWPGLGLAVQAYQKRALPVIRWLAALADQFKRKIPLRLVKGAYWDSEIKWAQEQGLDDYPVFTHKSATDVSYLACAKYILNCPQAFYPQFATHNAHTIAAIHEMGNRHPGYEFQRLHGMGERLYASIVETRKWHIPCRIYAPVGSYRDLLPYLVRRLLENGANTSFISHLDNPDTPIKDVIIDPVTTVRKNDHESAVQIAIPAEIYGEQRKNSHGLNLADPELRSDLQMNLDNLVDLEWEAYPLINGKMGTGTQHTIINPFNRGKPVGITISSDQKSVNAALDQAVLAWPEWRLNSTKFRADCLKKTADLLEKNRLELVSLCIRESGRCIPDALSEIREAVDFCRYYAYSAETQLTSPIELPGPVGEQNRLYRFGRGVFVCISPWNFPIAIFMGQITAALAAGNTVIAKPSQQTPLTAMLCVQLLHQSGIPENVLQFLPGEGSAIGSQLLADSRIAGVAFTGSTETARLINRQLANQNPAIIPLIAETGGQNVMIIDSSALAEQVIKDALYSAFNSAGQRCSALRVLYLQHEIADKIIELLIGAMQELILGNPGHLATDIGPVINNSAVQSLVLHWNKMQQQARILYQIPNHNVPETGSFFPPGLIELESLSQLDREVFGPILHVIRYKASELDKVIDDINQTGFGLTLGIQSRIEATIQKIQKTARVGNLYVNRNMIGAVVGVQPFGGMGLSGTGPKAGGPDYLYRFSVEQTLTTNSSAIGGNASLLAQDLS